MAPWLLRVASDANPSDSVSRFLFKLARKLKWRLAPAKIPLDCVDQLLEAPSSDVGLSAALLSLGTEPISVPVPLQARDLALANFPDEK